MVKSRAVGLTNEAVEPVTALLGSSKVKIKSAVEGGVSPTSYTGVVSVIIN